jgi:hypothetical protein
LLKIFIDFDENGDGVLTLDEFRELIKAIEVNMPMEKIIQLFNEALDSTNNEEESNNDSDKMAPESFVETILRNKIGGFGNEQIDFNGLQLN